jgi:hypothetical protein
VGTLRFVDRKSITFLWLNKFSSPVRYQFVFVSGNIILNKYSATSFTFFSKAELSKFSAVSNTENLSNLLEKVSVLWEVRVAAKYDADPQLLPVLSQSLFPYLRCSHSTNDSGIVLLLKMIFLLSLSPTSFNSFKLARANLASPLGTLPKFIVRSLS